MTDRKLKHPAGTEDGLREDGERNEMDKEREEQPSIAADEVSELDQLRADLEKARDQTLRAQADLDNYQKRVARDRTEERRYALMPLLRELLVVRDNLHRAVEAAENSDHQAGLLEGVKLVAQQIASVFQGNDCRDIEALGAEFDPNLHEVVSTLPSDEHPSGTVTAVVRIGFQLHDRVVRPVQVIVSSGPAKPQPRDEGEEKA